MDATCGQVTGVSLRTRGIGSREENLSAELVVDASGRTSRTPEWLAFGLRPPRETLVNVGLCYASRVYRRAAGGVRADYWRGVLLQPAPPLVNAPIEGARWVVTLSGRAGEQPPTFAG
jgi:hypothetical protein